LEESTKREEAADKKAAEADQGLRELVEEDEEEEDTPEKEEVDDEDEEEEEEDTKKTSRKISENQEKFVSTSFH
jgi:hypothetical protein